MTDHQTLRLLPTALAVWRRQGAPDHGIVFDLICRAWMIHDRRTCPEAWT